MKVRPNGLAALAVAALLGATSLPAQPGARGGGWGAGGPYHRLYNPQTVETITGEVVKVEKVSPMQGMGRGVHLLVKTEQETLPVHLGPAWFIENQELKVQPKDQVQVTGSRVTLNGKPALIAAEVQDGGEVLKLRDEQGIPLWAGWRRDGAGAAGGPGGRMMGPGGMGTNTTARGQPMMEEQRQRMAEMKTLDADLDRKVAQMNQAQGSAKVDAMAEVINDLLKERKLMRQRMAERHERMMLPMRPPAGAGAGAGSSNRSGASGQ